VPRSVARAAKGPTHRMINKDGARRADAGHNVENRADNEGWNSMTLDDMGDETDGLVAEGSVGDEQSKVNVGLLQLPSNRRGEFIFHLFMAPNTAHK
jgi:hypothetical protein